MSEYKTYSSLEVANFFLNKARQERRPISNMKILKMIYFAHGFYLAANNKPLVMDEIQAWEHGPVEPKLYNKLKRFGSGNIDLTKVELPSINNDSEIEDFLCSFYEQTANLTAFELSELTHSPKSPWHKAWLRGRNSVITDKDMTKYFSSLISEEA
jgi:uncharacterized phage-associated protein